MKFLAILLAAIAPAFAQSTNANTIVVIPKTDLSSTGELRFRDKQATPHYVGFKAPSSISANTIWTLPGADAAGCLQSNGAGALSLTTCGAASVANGFQITDKTAVGPPVTTIGWQAWYNTSDHSTNWLSYDNANALSPINLSASQFNIHAATTEMFGNITANAINTLSLGSKPTPWGSVFSMGNVSTRKVEVMDLGASDLTGPAWSIQATDSLIQKSLTFNDDANTPSLVLFRLLGGVTKKKGQMDGDWVPNVDATYNLGAPSLQWKDLNFSGQLIRGGNVWLDNTDNLTMRGNINSASVGSLSLGSKPNPFGSVFSLGNVSTTKLEIMNTGSIDLTGSAFNMQAINGLVQKSLAFNDDSNNPALTLFRLLGGVSVKKAQFDGDVVPNITNTYNLGSPSLQWKDVNFQGNLIQNGTTRLDSSGNLTVASCTGCGGGVVNGFLMTGKSVVSPPNASVGFQAWYDITTHSSNLLSYDGANQLSAINLSASAFTFTGTVNAVTMSGNISANAINTLSLGSKPTPWGSVFSMGNVSTRKVEVMDLGASDLTGPAWSIQATDGLITKTLTFNDDLNNPALVLYRLNGGVSQKKAQFDSDVVPNINNTYNLGSASLQWKDVNFQGNLIQNGTTRLDSSGNLTVASCSGCVANIYLPLAGGTMSGNINANAINTLSLGSKPTPWGSVFSMGNVSTRKVEVMDLGASDLTGPAWSIQATDSLVTKTLTFNDDLNNPALVLYRLNGGVSQKKAQFDGDVVPNITNTYNLGSPSLQWKDVNFQGNLIQNGTTRLDSSGNLTVASCTGCVTTSYLPLAGGTMSGNISASAAGTLSLGSKPLPFGSVFSLGNVSTTKLEIYTTGSSDLTGSAFNIQAIDGLVQKSIAFNDDSNNPALTLFRLLGGVSVKKAQFDGDVVPNITNTYSLGSSSGSLWWKDINWQGNLNQNGAIRMDSGGNMTITSLVCTGSPCPATGTSSVANGFFVTGQSTVNPLSTAVGLQVYHDPSSHTAFIKNFNASNTLAAIDISGSTNFNQPLTLQGGIQFGSTPTISSAFSGAPIQIFGSNTTNGNILITPGPATGGNNSVRIFAAVNSQPALKIINFAGSTTSTSFEIDSNNQTSAQFWVESDGNPTSGNNCPSCVHTASIIPTADALYTLGQPTKRFNFYYGANANFGLSPSTTFGVPDIPANTIVQVVGNGQMFLDLDAFGGTSAIPGVIGRNAGGTQASPSSVPQGAVLLAFYGRGYVSGSGFTTTASSGVTEFANEPWTGSAQGADVRIETTAAGSSSGTRATRAIFNNSGINPGADNTYSLGTTGPCTNGGGTPCRWANAQFVNATIGTLNVTTCNGCGGSGSFNPAANITFTGNDSFTAPTTLSNAVITTLAVTGLSSVQNVNLNGDFNIGNSARILPPTGIPLNTTITCFSGQHVNSITASQGIITGVTCN